MTRSTRNPIIIANNVELTINGNNVLVKGPKGQLGHTLNRAVSLTKSDNSLSISVDSQYGDADAQAGTVRALLTNMLMGVTEEFEKALEIVGVGYRANVQGDKLNLSLGFSHPVVYQIPKGVTIQAPSQTELVIRGIDKQLVGQVAANIRAYRKPDSYKGKGVRFKGENIVLKEAKKK